MAFARAHCAMSVAAKITAGFYPPTSADELDALKCVIECNG
jgi:hypothetical protein